jgi:Fe-S cluster assembly ATP-binding protein
MMFKKGELMILEIKNLHAEAAGKKIINGLNLKVNSGEFHVIMGPNGSGKTTLSNAIMGYPGVKITEGEILVDGKTITNLPVNERAKLGLFLQFQNPVEIDGVGFVNFIRTAKDSLGGSTTGTKELMNEIKSYTESLKIKNGIIGRNLNQGFSGGEKKKAEILQLAVLKPKIAILDEPDSGLDVDSIKDVATAINEIAKKEKSGLIVITHYSRILNYMKPNFVHIMVNGTIISEGGPELIEKIEKEGYESISSKS